MKTIDDFLNSGLLKREDFDKRSYVQRAFFLSHLIKPQLKSVIKE